MRAEGPLLAPSRRVFLTALGGAALTPWDAVARPVSPGEALYSESVQLGALTANGLTGLRLRLCRYPAANVAWVWVHAFTPDGAFNYCDNLRPCGADKAALESDDTYYAPKKGSLLNFRRTGPRSAPTGLSVNAAVHAHPTGEVRKGDGPVPLRITANFAPKRAVTGLVDARSEVSGEAEFEIRAGKAVFRATAPAQMHEQPQSTPRFAEPFTYGSLWGAARSCTFLSGPRGAAGYIAYADRPPMAAASVEIEPPGPSRRIRLNFKDAPSVEFPCRRTHVFDQPVFDIVKPGSMVVSEQGGEQFSGGVNDWMPEKLRYWSGL